MSPTGMNRSIINFKAFGHCQNPWLVSHDSYYNIQIQLPSTTNSSKQASLPTAYV